MRTMDAPRWRRWCCLAFWAVLMQLTGCASVYLDGGTREAAVSEYRKPEPARPAQVLFEFQTKGVANAVATQQLKGQVLAQLRDSGLFSSVGELPVPGGALVAITLNNVPLSDDAFQKGFVTGLTFGLAGSQVSDGYVCTLTYSREGAAPVTQQVRHAIHTTMGAAAAPGNATKMASLQEAATTMTRQVVSQALLALSRHDGFR